MDVVLDRLARALLGGLEQRTDVDVEAEVGERAWRRPWRRGRGRPGRAWRSSRAGGGPASSANAAISRLQLVPAFGAVVGGCIHPEHLLRVGAMAPVDLLERVADLADRGAGPHRVDRQRRAGCRRRLCAAAVSASSALRHRRAVARGAQRLQPRRPGCRAPRGCRCRASRSASSSSSLYLLTPTITSLPESMRACFSAALASICSLAQPLSTALRHAAHRLDLLDDLPGRVGHLLRQLFHQVAAGPRVDDVRDVRLFLDDRAGCCGRCAS